MIFNPNNLKPGPKFAGFDKINIEACYFDVDNTLVENDSAELPSEKFRALAIEVGFNIPVNIATARSFQRVEHILRSIHSQGISVLSNGAVLYDGKKEEIIEDLQIGKSATENICIQLRQAGIRHQIQDDGIDYCWQDVMLYSNPKNPLYPAESHYEPSQYQPCKPRLIDAKIFTEHEENVVRKLIGALISKSISVSVGHIGIGRDGKKFKELFIMHSNANKQHALLRAYDIQGLEKENILAVGDGPNDKVLLELAGVSVAMGNAFTETLAEANFVAPTQKEEGAACVLGSFLSTG